MASLTYELTLAGLSVGAAAALTGVGLVVTYRATGVLNFAHGAIAMFCAYVLRQLVVVWDWPLWAGAALVLLGVAPALGLALERGVFRPLAVSGNDPAQTLVASIGVFVLLVGAAALLWGTGAQEDAPVLIAADPWGQLAVVCAVAVTVWAVTRLTRFGGELRAVVDDRRLAVLGGVDADRVAAVGWAFGACTAGLTGVLLAPYVRLDPYGLPLLVMEVVAVAVAARMRYLSVAVGVALAVGVAQSQLTRLHPGGWAQPLLQAVGANLFVVALLVAALVLPAVGGAGALSRAATRRVVPAPPGAWPVAGVLFLLPLGFAGSDLHTAVQVPALALILLSLVVVTGRAGQLALGQGAFAGLGALFAVLLSLGRFPGLPQLPGLAALLLAVLLVAPLGLLTALPAIGRHGLALALATFAVGVGVSRFVFAQPYAASGLVPPRPAGLADDRAFYALELVLLCGALLVVRQVRRGRAGRALAALRDDEAGAAAAGVPVAALKVAAFVLAAALAALGGALLAFGLHSFDPASFDPVRGLLWFAAIVVLGADGPLSALLGAALLVGLDAGTRGGVAAATIGLLAVLVGRFPEGPYAAVRSLSTRARGRGRLTERGAAVRVRLGRGGGGPGTERAEPGARGGGPGGLGAGAGGAEVRPGAGGADVRPGADGADAEPGADGADVRSPAGGSDVKPEAGAADAKPETSGTYSEPRADGADAGPAASCADAGPRADGADMRSQAGGVNAQPEARAAHTKPGANRADAGPGADGADAGPGASGTDMRSQAGGADAGPAASSADAGPRADGADMRSQAGGADAHPEAGAAHAKPETSDAYTKPRADGADAGPAASSADAGPRADGADMRSQAGGADAHPEARAAQTKPETSDAHAEPEADGADAGPRAGGADARPGASGTDAGPRADGADAGPGVGGAPPTPPPAPNTPAESPGRAPVLACAGVVVRFGGRVVLDGVGVRVEAGRVAAVVGDNGAGKSTLFHCLAGTLRPDAGQVWFGGRDVTRTAAHTRTRLGVARTFQQLVVFPSLSVGDNIRVGAEQGRVRDPGATARLLRLLRVPDGRRTDDLSTGMLRRVELARALAGRPHVLLLDEPTAGLDDAEVDELARLLKALAADGTALLIVEHDLELVAALADTVHVLDGGRIVASGPPGEVLPARAGR
ncbi:ATP-binding cassette domain-containing protein [Streptomyces sp. NPDC050145]|uniref:ABC transporter permease subunit n=1 Tax=Streptomyces sp. NPDC050145 TaxID=3365602 RepID=UPI00378C1BFE